MNKDSREYVSILSNEHAGWPEFSSQDPAGSVQSIFLKRLYFYSFYLKMVRAIESHFSFNCRERGRILRKKLNCSRKVEVFIINFFNLLEIWYFDFTSTTITYFTKSNKKYTNKWRRRNTKKSAFKFSSFIFRLLDFWNLK